VAGPPWTEISLSTQKSAQQPAARPPIPTRLRANTDQLFSPEGDLNRYINVYPAMAGGC
jgi:hypothetical protein